MWLNSKKYLQEIELEYKGRVVELELEHKKALQEQKRQFEEKLYEIKNSYEEKIRTIKLNHSIEINELRGRTESEFYKKMQTEYAELQKHGDANTNFVKDLALKMVERSSGGTKQLEDKKD